MFQTLEIKLVVVGAGNVLENDYVIWMKVTYSDANTGASSIN